MNVYLRVNFWVIFLWLRNNNGIFEIFVQILVLSSLDSILDLIVSPQNFRIEVLTLTWWVNSSPLNLHFKYMHILCLILWVGKRISSEIDSQLSSRYGHKLNLIFVFLNIFYALVPCLENSWHSLSSVLCAASSLLVVPISVQSLLISCSLIYWFWGIFFCFWSSLQKALAYAYTLSLFP